MLCRLSAGLLGCALLALAALPSAAQEKKDAPKKREKIAINDPEKAKADPDFAIQGEYEGTLLGKKTGIQIVAQGDGKFAVVGYHTGLPGAGWDGEAPMRESTAVRDGAKAVLKNPEGKVWGQVADGVITFNDAPKDTFKKVERKSKTLGAKPPEGAVVLFGGPGDEAKWNGGKLVELPDGKFLNVGVTSKQAFGAFKAHVEFRTPWMPNSRGQGRGNSGVYFQNRYECQVLDSFGLSGADNECGGIYQQYKPLVNMCYPPLSWQTYDIEFTPAAFDAAGKRTKPARATVLHNGVKIHDNIELKGPTGGGQPEKPTPGPFQFQNHGDPVVYNNVWVVETK